MRRILLMCLLACLPLRWAVAAEPVLNVDETKLQKDFVRYDEEQGLRVGDKLSFFGYGELHYNNIIGSSDDEIDFHRYVFGVGVDFTDWLQFRGEVDFEHAATELELEQAYLDFLINDYFNPRVGIILAPVDYLNQHHEPTFFYSVERPMLDTVVLPTTWYAAGVGFHGKTQHGLEYQVYLMEAPDAVDEADANNGFKGTKGLHDGLRLTAEAPGRDFIGAFRLDYKGLPGFQVGTSFFIGNTGQGNVTVNGGLMSLFEADAHYQIQGLEFIASGAWIHLRDAGNINNALLAIDPAFNDFVANDMFGWYFEAAYHLFHHMWPAAKHDVVIFGRHERYNTQAKMPAGFARNVATNRNTTTFGVAYFPIKQVALKLDYNLNRNEAGTANDQLNLGFAFHY